MLYSAIIHTWWKKTGGGRVPVKSYGESVWRISLLNSVASVCVSRHVANEKWGKDKVSKSPVLKDPVSLTYLYQEEQKAVHTAAQLPWHVLAIPDFEDRMFPYLLATYLSVFSHHSLFRSDKV